MEYNCNTTTPSESEPLSSTSPAPSLHAPVMISFPDMEITIQLQSGEEQSLKSASMDSLLQRLSDHIKARSSPVPAAPKRVMVSLSHEENEFRKGSVAMGHVSTQFINPISSMKHMTAAERRADDTTKFKKVQRRVRDNKEQLDLRVPFCKDGSTTKEGIVFDQAVTMVSFTPTKPDRRSAPPSRP